MSTPSLVIISWKVEAEKGSGTSEQLGEEASPNVDQRLLLDASSTRTAGSSTTRVHDSIRKRIHQLTP
jgi:hypothetical protein